ncbi:TonB family protein [Labilibacter marinus]|uniref:TonB family protein n=1 Tax=Labilibacter marinus TaxID=1477105 RepID=UPI0009F85421|nr:TonB family protein [Labilibacter marinus]
MPSNIHFKLFRISLILILTLGFITQLSAQKVDFKYKKGYYHLLTEKRKVNKSIEPFNYAEPFSEGLALVEKDLKFGFIDKTGKLVIPFKFTDAGSFKKGITYAAVNGKYGYINKQGEFIIEPQFEMAYNFEGEFADVCKFLPGMSDTGIPNREEAIIDKQGNLLAGRYFTSISFNEEKDCFKATYKDTSFFVSKEGTISFDKLIKKKEYLIVDEMPSFPRGDYAMRKFIASGVKYPISAINSKIAGSAKISFIIDEKGLVQHVRSASNIHPLLEKEARRLVAAMPQWSPGIQKGKAVNVSFTVPINFVLQ